MQKKSISFYTATAVVISNMIGTGVFTSLGYQVMGIKSGFALLLLWFIGGIAALLGALCYGELGAALPRSGGEYNYLSKIYHPALGFLSGWVSATVGFAAPVAAASMAFAEYLKKGGDMQAIIVGGTDISSGLFATIIIILVSCIHFLKVHIGSRFQNIFTAISIVTITVIIISGLFAGHTGNADFSPTSSALHEILSSSFAISFFFVTFAYSGWNAAAYIAGEMDNVQENLPKVLLRGTAIVTLLYILLNFVFLYTTPLAELEGKKEVGFIAATYIFGTVGGKIMAIIIAVKLISTISSMTLAGPRIISVMGEDLSLFKKLSLKNKHEVPAYAILVQSAIALVFVFTSTFDQVITFIGFTLNLFTFLTVTGLLILRIKQPDLPRPFKTPFYPLTPLIFMGISLWLIYFGVADKPLISLAAMATVLSGLVLYFISRKAPLSPSAKE
jgi:APA family basic amino acid/polyamine antiporter